MKYFFFPISFCFGIIFGILFQNYHLLKITNEVRILELINVLLTISLAFIIPFVVKLWIDDSKQVKQFLIEEVKNLLNLIEKINDCINKSYCDSRSAQNSKDININFTNSDHIVESLIDQMKISYPKSSKNLINEVKNIHHGFWRFVTEGEIIYESGQLTDNLYGNYSIEYKNYQNSLKLIIHKIYKL